MAGLAILMVEDDAFVADALGDALAETGEVVIEPTAAAAITALQRRRFDVVLCDWQLPDGPSSLVVELARRAGVPVIIMTGDGAAFEHLVAHGHQVLAKPFSLHDLRRKLREAGCGLGQ